MTKKEFYNLRQIKKYPITFDEKCREFERVEGYTITPQGDGFELKDNLLNTIDYFTREEMEIIINNYFKFDYATK